MADINPSEWPKAKAYFDSYSDGREDAEAYLQFIYKLADVQLSEDSNALFIGRAGADSIQFAYRKGLDGIWAHHPIENRWQWIAKDIAALEHGWLGRTLTV